MDIYEKTANLLDRNETLLEETEDKLFDYASLDKLIKNKNLLNFEGRENKNGDLEFCVWYNRYPKYNSVITKPITKTDFDIIQNELLNKINSVIWDKNKFKKVINDNSDLKGSVELEDFIPDEDYPTVIFRDIEKNKEIILDKPLSETDLVKFLKNKLGKVSSKKVEESVSVVYEKAASMLVKEIYLAESKRDTEEFKEDLKNEFIKEFKNSMDEKSGLDFSLETALYWFANDYHSGQNDIWYSVLSTSDYRPGRSEKSVEDTEDMWAENFYEWLKKRFTGKKKKNISEAKSDKDPFEEAVLDSAEKIFKEFKGIRWREFISLILKDLHWNANNFSKVVYVLNPYYGLGKNEIVYEK